MGFAGVAVVAGLAWWLLVAKPQSQPAVAQQVGTQMADAAPSSGPKIVIESAPAAPVVAAPAALPEPAPAAPVASPAVVTEPLQPQVVAPAPVAAAAPAPTAAIKPAPKASEAAPKPPKPRPGAQPANEPPWPHAGSRAPAPPTLSNAPAPAPQQPAVTVITAPPADGLGPLRAALRQCDREDNMFSKGVCVVKARHQHCGNHWGRVPDCPMSSRNNDPYAN
jgi:hypothetical protein